MQFDKKGGFFLFEGSNVAYNVNDAGQFMWGHAMKLSGFSITSAIFGANSHALLSSGQLDSEADQAAIKSGFFYNTKKVTSEFKFTQPWGKWMPVLNISSEVEPNAGVFTDLPEFETEPRRP